MAETVHINLISLIGQDVALKRVANTNGGEYAGPCPWCGGEDRFRVWPSSDKPGYWCRQCGRRGDAIQYIRDRDGVSFRVACKYLELPIDEQSTLPKLLAPRLNPGLARTEWEATHNPAWQRAANNFVDRAFDALNSWAPGQPARDYLMRRGLTETTMAAHYLGYNPQDYRARWGNVDVFIPGHSIIFPWEEYPEHWDGKQWVPPSLFKVKYRRIDRKQYGQAKGGAEGLYGWFHFQPLMNVILVESELCALSIWAAAPGLVIPLATGSTTGARTYSWIAQLATAGQLILSFDNDVEGKKATQWWKTAFPHALRLRPTRHDVNDMLTAGDDITNWLSTILQPN